MNSGRGLHLINFLSHCSDAQLVLNKKLIKDNVRNLFTSRIDWNSRHVGQLSRLYDVMRLPVSVAVNERQSLCAERIVRRCIRVASHDVAVCVAVRHLSRRHAAAAVLRDDGR